VGLAEAFRGPTFNECVLTGNAVQERWEAASPPRHRRGLPIERDYPELGKRVSSSA
jgi:hypothetical protein